MDDVVQVVSGILFDDSHDKILIVNNIGGTWSFPGRAVEQGEILENAMVREAFEETGLNVKINRLIAISEGFSESRQKKFVFFGFLLSLSDPDQVPSIQIADEISEMKWVERAELFQKLPWLQYDPWHVVAGNDPVGFYRSELP